MHAVPTEVRRGHQTFWNWSCRWLWTIVWVTGSEARSSAWTGMTANPSLLHQDLISIAKVPKLSKSYSQLQTVSLRSLSSSTPAMQTYGTPLRTHAPKARGRWQLALAYLGTMGIFFVFLKSKYFCSRWCCQGSGRLQSTRAYALSKLRTRGHLFVWNIYFSSWRNDSVLKNTYCSYRRPKFGSHHWYQLTTICNSTSQGSNALFSPLFDSSIHVVQRLTCMQMHACAWVRACTHTLYIHTYIL